MKSKAVRVWVVVQKESGVPILPYFTRFEAEYTRRQMYLSHNFKVVRGTLTLDEPTKRKGARK
jgi:hypothetical protein